MADRNFTNQQFAMEKCVVSLFAKVTFGSTGAPTLVVANSKAVKSVTRTGTGKYVFVFGTSALNQSLDTYNKLLCVKHVFNTVGTAAAPTAPSCYIAGDSTAAAAASLTLQFNAAGTATDPASGEAVLIEFKFCNSTAF